MSKGAFISSAVLHGVVLTLIAMEFSFARFNAPPPPAILMVDLTKVKISDKTNLPPKTEVKKEQKKAEAKPIPPKPKDPPKAQPTKVQEKKPEPPKPKPQPPAKDSAKIIEPPKPKKEEKKPAKKETPKPTPVPPPKSEEPKKPQPADKLKSLLTSVEKVRKTAPTSAPPAPLPMDQQVTTGIEGGSDGSLSQILTISERDLIASQLTKCWNIDPGKKDIDDAIVEIRVSVNKDGSVRDVQVVNSKQNGVFQSVADSARRAVWICDKDPEKSPFKMLAEKYTDHYTDWKTILLRFNPKTGGVI